MIWPWQYPAKLREAKARIDELKLAGWELVCYSYELGSKTSRAEWEELNKTFNWSREFGVFGKDKPIDGPRPQNPCYKEYHDSARRCIALQAKGQGE